MSTYWIIDGVAMCLGPSDRSQSKLLAQVRPELKHLALICDPIDGLIVFIGIQKYILLAFWIAQRHTSAPPFPC